MTNSAKSLHKEILSELKKYSGQRTKHSKDSNYLGHNHFSYHISNPVKRKIIKEFIAKHKNISVKEFTGLLNLLFSAKSYDEKAIAGMLVGYRKTHRINIKLDSLDFWLSHLTGWAEIDSLCQSNFTVEEMLSNWKAWKAFLIKLSKDKNISKRRASLVLLTWPISKSNDSRLLEIAFNNIDRLKTEKDILITKAISWLLRSMVKHHKKAVTLYIKQNVDSLPKIAIRETRRKILTGRK